MTSAGRLFELTMSVSPVWIYGTEFRPLNDGKPLVDAHGCIMVRVLRTYRIQGCGAIDTRPKAGSPLIVIPTAPSVPSFSELCLYVPGNAQQLPKLRRSAN